MEAEASLWVRVRGRVRRIADPTDVPAGAGDVLVAGPPDADATAARAAFRRYDELARRVGAAVRFALPDLADGFHVVLGDDPLPPFADPRPAVVAKLRLCRDLDDVLALAPPRRLAAALFGPDAPKTLLEPLGDALLRGLAHAERERRPLTLSSVVLASALGDLLDPERLAQVLAWDDDGLDLVPAVSPTDLSDDLCTVLGQYRDRNRRLRLLRSLWAAQHRSAAERQRGQDRLDALRRSPRRADARNVGQWLLAIPDATATDEASDEAAGDSAGQLAGSPFLATRMLEQLAAAARQSEARAVAVIVQRHPGLYAEIADTSARRHADAAKLWTHLADYQWTLDVLQEAAPLFDRFAEAASAKGRRNRLFDASRLVQLQAELERLVRLAAADRISPVEIGQWLYRGHLCRIWLEGEERLSPPAADDLAAAAAQVAQLVRLGADLPPKPASWDALLAHAARPFYELGGADITAPSWTNSLHEQTLSLQGKRLVVRLPQSMRELVRWAEHMGNCIASLHGQRIADGRLVMTGVFDPTDEGEVLRYNAAADPSTGRLVEINSRFNAGDVPEEVERALRALMLRCRTEERERDERSTAALEDEHEPLARARRRRRTDPLLAQEIGRAAESIAGAVWDDSVLCAIGGGESWRAALAALEDEGPELLSRWLQRQPSGIDGLFDALLTHPLDGVLSGALSPDGTALLDRVRTGDERARLPRPAPALGDPRLEAAWRLAVVQRSLLQALVAQVVAAPRDAGLLVRRDRNARARWPLAVVATAARVAQVIASSGRRSPGWVPIPDGHVTGEHWRLAHRMAPELVSRLLDTCGFAGLDDPELETASARMVEKHLPPLAIPRPWLS